MVKVCILALSYKSTTRFADIFSYLKDWFVLYNLLQVILFFKVLFRAKFWCELRTLNCEFFFHFNINEGECIVGEKICHATSIVIHPKEEKNNMSDKCL